MSQFYVGTNLYFVGSLPQLKKQHRKSYQKKSTKLLKKFTTNQIDEKKKNSLNQKQVLILKLFNTHMGRKEVIKVVETRT